RSLGVRELWPTLQLASQDLVLSGEIFIPQQQLLVHRPADVGQDACPLHELPLLPAGSQWPPLIAPNNVTDNARRAHAEWHKLPKLSCSANFLAIRVPKSGFIAAQQTWPPDFRDGSNSDCQGALNKLKSWSPAPSQADLVPRSCA